MQQLLGAELQEAKQSLLFGRATLRPVPPRTFSCSLAFISCCRFSRYTSSKNSRPTTQRRASSFRFTPSAHSPAAPSQDSSSIRSAANLFTSGRSSLLHFALSATRRLDFCPSSPWCVSHTDCSSAFRQPQATPSPSMRSLQVAEAKASATSALA